jgi:carboxymethylenebutenolidase
MCHLDSVAPPVPDGVLEHPEQTNGPDPIPYVRIESANADTAATIVLITDIFGINPFYRHLGALLATQGYRVIIPDVFHRVGPPTDSSRDAALSRRRLLDDTLAVDDLERILEHTAGEKRAFGVLGFCIGGSFALLTAATHPNQATVTYYAFPKGTPGAKVPVTEPLQIADTISGPVLAHWGREDYIDTDEIDQLTTALAKAPGTADVRWYEHAGHSFLAGLTDPDHEATEAAADSWNRTVRFFQEYLGGPSAS